MIYQSHGKTTKAGRGSERPDFFSFFRFEISEAAADICASKSPTLLSIVVGVFSALEGGGVSVGGFGSSGGGVPAPGVVGGSGEKCRVYNFMPK
jgi:hypothetical protein